MQFFCFFLLQFNLVMSGANLRDQRTNKWGEIAKSRNEEFFEKQEKKTKGKFLSIF